MTAPFLDRDELKRRGLTIEGETPPPSPLVQSPQNILLSKPPKHAKESELQRNVEGYLQLHGYRPRTPDEIKRGGECAGWYIHIHNAQGNPIILDLLILSAEGWFCEIELKSETGKPTEEQSELVKRGGYLCRTLEEVKQAMEEKRINWSNCV
jgi:hypothetical protein